MPERYILALDQGTTGSTALIFDPQAKLRGKGYREFEQHYPQPGWVEHDPEEIFRVTVEVGREAIQNAGIHANQVSAVGITNQRETIAVWERATGQPIHRAIVWQCRRTTDVCEKLMREGFENEVRALTGLVINPYFAATKLAWILDHVPGARDRASRGELAAGTIDSWLIWKLTHGAIHSTDLTNASRTLLCDIHKRSWSPRLCEIFNVPISILPKIQASASDFGATHPEEFGNTIPIRGVAGDQQAALFGHCAVQKNQAKCTFGTGAFAMAYGGETAITSQHRLLTTIACGPKGEAAYALEGAVFIAGAVIQWLRDGLQIIQKASETEAIARSIPDTAGVYFVPAFVGLGAPYWDSGARGAILGMTRGTTRAHVVRAALESIAFQTGDMIDAMASDLGKPLAELHVDGGAAENDFLLQFLADLLGIPVIRPPMLELTGFGAARLAAIASDFWKTSLTLPGNTTEYQPKISANERAKRREGWQNAVRRVRSEF